jgi:hypothetical protein
MHVFESVTGSAFSAISPEREEISTKFQRRLAQQTRGTQNLPKLEESRNRKWSKPEVKILKILAKFFKRGFCEFFPRGFSCGYLETFVGKV